MNEFIYNNGVKGGYPYVGVKGAEPRTPFKEGEAASYNEIAWVKGAQPVETKEELVAALAEGGRVRVTKSFTLNSSVTVKAKEKTVISLDKDVVISNVSNDDKGAAFILNSADSTLVIEGEGKIDSKIGVWAKKGTVIVYGGEFDSDSQCIRMNDKGAGLENREDIKVVIKGGTFKGGDAGVVTFGGEIEIDGGEFENFYYAVSANGGAVDHNSSCLINGGTFKSTATDGAALYWPASGALTINGGSFEGTDALYIKCGDVAINNGTFVGKGPKASYVFHGNGFNPTGDCIVVDRCNYPGGDAKVAINGGSFKATADDTNDVGIYFGNGDTPETTAGTFTVNCSGVDVKIYPPANDAEDAE